MSTSTPPRRSWIGITVHATALVLALLAWSRVSYRIGLRESWSFGDGLGTALVVTTVVIVLETWQQRRTSSR